MGGYNTQHTCVLGNSEVERLCLNIIVTPSRIPIREREMLDPPDREMSI